MKQRPDLIVPIRDRRQQKRYLTLRNFAIASAVALAAFICVSIYSEVRGPAPNDYGRLARREAAAPPVAVQPIAVVPEEIPIDDQSSADPTLIQPMMRAQSLGIETSSDGLKERVPAPAIQRGSETVVVGREGGMDGKRKRRLSGGFGRP